MVKMFSSSLLWIMNYAVFPYVFFSWKYFSFRKRVHQAFIESEMRVITGIRTGETSFFKAKEQKKSNPLDNRERN